MKKLLSLILALLLIVGISGCQFGGDPQVTTQPSTEAATTLPDSTLPDSTLPQETESHLPEQTDPPIDSSVKKEVPYLMGKDEDTAIKVLKTHGFADPKIVYVNSYEEKGTVVEQSVLFGKEVSIATVITIKISNGKAPVIQTEPPREDNYPPEQEEQPTEDATVPATQPPTEAPTQPSTTKPALDPNGSYTTAKDVALYIRLYGKLPPNFITKSQAKNMYGSTNGLNKYGKCIGGDRFYNNEGLLPDGYTYYECDIDTLYSSKRGAKRLVYTKSGIIYYTDDHYKSFTKLYG